MPLHVTRDADSHRSAAYDNVRHNAGRLRSIVQEIYLHTMIKGHLLAGQPQAWIAQHGRVSKKTIAEVTRTPLMAVEELNRIFDLDVEDLLTSMFDTSPTSTITPHGAIFACMAYDLEYIPTEADTETLQLRYNTTPRDLLIHLQQAHARLVINRTISPDPGRSYNVAEFCARQLGCTNDQIEHATMAITDWLRTPIVPEVANVVYHSTSVGRSDPRHLYEKLCAQRWERESAEIAAYGSSRPVVDDTDESPAAIGRDLLLVAEGVNTQPSHVGYRDGLSRGSLIDDFGRKIGLAASGVGSNGRVIADTDQGWVEAVDHALYDAHQVHLPHLDLANDPGPWPHTVEDLTSATPTS